MEYKKGQTVYIDTVAVAAGNLQGICLEDECLSPTKQDPDRKVVRIKWELDDEATAMGLMEETIENTKHIY